MRAGRAAGQGSAWLWGSGGSLSGQEGRRAASAGSQLMGQGWGVLERVEKKSLERTHFSLV